MGPFFRTNTTSNNCISCLGLREILQHPGVHDAEQIYKGFAINGTLPLIAGGDLHGSAPKSTGSGRDNERPVLVISGDRRRRRGSVVTSCGGRVSAAAVQMRV